MTEKKKELDYTFQLVISHKPGSEDKDINDGQTKTSSKKNAETDGDGGFVNQRGHYVGTC